MRKRNRYVWRLDFSLLEKDNYKSEIGKEMKKNIGIYKVSLLMGVLCGLLILIITGLFIYNSADLTYIIIFGIVALLICPMYCRFIKTPKITMGDLEKIENEMNVKSEAMKEFDAIFTENSLIVLQGIMVYRIPYNEISRIRIKRRTNRAGGTSVQYRTCDGSQVETVYYCYRLKPFDTLWEQLLKYNPNIFVEDSLWIRPAKQN